MRNFEDIRVAVAGTGIGGLNQLLKCVSVVVSQLPHVT